MKQLPLFISRYIHKVPKRNLNSVEIPVVIDVWRGVWRCTHAKLAPLTPHPLARDRPTGLRRDKRGTLWGRQPFCPHFSSATQVCGRCDYIPVVICSWQIRSAVILIFWVLLLKVAAQVLHPSFCSSWHSLEKCQFTCGNLYNDNFHFYNPIFTISNPVACSHHDYYLL